jgi:hypothetical protein
MTLLLWPIISPRAVDGGHRFSQRIIDKAPDM